MADTNDDAYIIVHPYAKYQLILTDTDNKKRTFNKLDLLSDVSF